MTQLFDRTLTVCIDPANLSGLLALEPTLAMIRAASVDVRWWPLVSPLSRLSSKQPNESPVDPLAAYKARRARARERWAERELERDCRRLGIDPASGRREFDPRPAAMAMLFLGERGGDVPAFLERIYRRGFYEGADIADSREVARLVNDAAFDDYRPAQDLDALQASLLEAGVFMSPAFIYREEVFQGRQHLPLLAAYLSTPAELPAKA